MHSYRLIRLKGIINFERINLLVDWLKNNPFEIIILMILSMVIIIVWLTVKAARNNQDKIYRIDSKTINKNKSVLILQNKSPQDFIPNFQPQPIDTQLLSTPPIEFATNKNSHVDDIKQDNQQIINNRENILINTEIISYKSQFQSNTEINNKNHIQWASLDDVIDVAGYHIEKPITYWSSGKTNKFEASCIGKHLRVKKAEIEPQGKLGYWPSYSQMTPEQRGFYLYWLATGRNEPLREIGYAFVYFYGLEKRALMDGEDIHIIMQEVLRLLRQHTESGSFNGYLTQFITYINAHKGLNNLTHDKFNLYFMDKSLNYYTEDLLALILCWLYLNNIPMPVSLAYEVAKKNIQTSNSVVIGRAPEQFRLLFNNKYNDMFNDGMKLRAAKNDRTFRYHPASPSLFPYNGWQKLDTKLSKNKLD